MQKRPGSPYWFSLERNDKKFEAMYGKEGGVAANNSVYYEAGHASALELPVGKKSRD